MSFTVTDFHDLTRLFYKYPEWRAEMRRLVLSDELLELPELVRQLAAEQQIFAQSQNRTEQSVGELATAQQRTEQRVGELAVAQKSTEEAVRGLSIEVRELGTDVKGLRMAVGQMQRSFGATVEDEAESVIEWVLKQKGYRVLAPPVSLPLDGEIDVVMPMSGPDGEKVWVVAEAKARLGRQQVRDWAQRIRSRGWQQRLLEQDVPGPYLVYAYAIRIDLGTAEEAQEQGIGLATGRGERVAPAGLIPSVAA
mgnify:CR=1 FL=1